MSFGRSHPRGTSDPEVLPTLFITRKFPPAVGGMETLAENVWHGLRSAEESPVLIAHGGSVPVTLLWLPGALIRMLLLVLRGRVGRVLCGDVLLYAVVGPLLWLTRTRHAVMAMGLDVTYDSELYRRTVLPVFRRAPSVLAISEATADAVRSAGVPGDRVRVLALGVRDPQVDSDQVRASRAELHRQLDLDEDRLVLLTLGRLVPRKGVAWFLTNVVPRLADEVDYVIAGDGPDRELIEQRVGELGVGDRVHVLGKVSDDQRNLLMRGADVFVQPNIPVPGDMEGFGLVAIEAAMSGTLVVASDLEGLRDAVADGVTGHLVAPSDARAWQDRLGEVLSDRSTLDAEAERFQRACIRRSSLEVMASQLTETLRDLE